MSISEEINGEELFQLFAVLELYQFLSFCLLFGLENAFYEGLSAELAYERALIAFLYRTAGNFL
jgi:hypothetical protein